MSSPRPKNVRSPEDCRTDERPRRARWAAVVPEEEEQWATVDETVDALLHGLADPEKRFEAAWMLKRTLVAHPEAKDRVLGGNGVALLLHLLTVNDPGRVDAIGALQNLVTKHRPSQDAVRALKGITQLVKLLENQDLRRHVLGAIRNVLSGNEDNKREFCFEGGIRAVTSLAPPSSGVAAAALDVLQNACTGNGNNKYLVCVQALDYMLEHLALPSYRDSLKTIRNMACTENSESTLFQFHVGAALECVSKRVAEAVVPFLCSDACAEAAEALANLARMDRRIRDQIEATDAPVYLQQMLNGPNREHARRVLSHLRPDAYETAKKRENASTMARLRNATFEVPVPEEYACPITLQTMECPVLCDDGHTYEKNALFGLFSANGRYEDGHMVVPSPMTRELIQLKTIRANFVLKNIIETHAETFWKNVQALVDAASGTRP